MNITIPIQTPDETVIFPRLLKSFIAALKRWSNNKIKFSQLPISISEPVWEQSFKNEQKREYSSSVSIFKFLLISGILKDLIRSNCFILDTVSFAYLSWFIRFIMFMYIMIVTNAGQRLISKTPKILAINIGIIKLRHFAYLVHF